MFASEGFEGHPLSMLAKRPSRRVVAVPLAQPTLSRPAPPERAPEPHDRTVPTPAAEAVPRRRVAVV
jgi:hypothetical protein